MSGALGLPLPTGTLYQMQQKNWPDTAGNGPITDLERMQMQDAAYDGRFKPPLKRTDQSEADHNVYDNRCEPIVSAGVDFLYGDDLGMEVVNEDDSPDDEAQKYLDSVWDANLKMATLAEYEINSAVFGHSFIKLCPDDADTAPLPSLAVLNPMQMQVQTQPTDVRKVARYAFTYQDVDAAGNVVECRQLTERQPGGGGWVIRDQTKRSGVAETTIAGALSQLDRQDVRQSDSGWEDIPAGASEPWGYSWSPIHDGKNLPRPNSYWGKADLRLDIIHLQDVLNFLLSNRHRILYFQGHPRDIFFGVRTHEIDVTPGGSICIPNINAKVQHIELAGDLVAIANAIEEIRESMDELSHVPSVAVGRLKNLPGVPSGVALKVAYRPLIAQTLQKRVLREHVLRPLCQHILELGGYGENRKIVFHWPEMLPSDDLQEAQTAQLWQGIGASRDTLLERGGFTPEVEKQKRDKEAKEALAQAQKEQKARLKTMQAAGAQPQMGPDGQPMPMMAGQPQPGVTPPALAPFAAATASKAAGAAPNGAKNGAQSTKKPAKQPPSRG